MQIGPLFIVFKKLNTKIILYFLSFAFLPLLVFSLLGYYLNKDLITDINVNQLKHLNNAYGAKIDLYLDEKAKTLESILNAYEISGKTVSIDVYANERNSEFIKMHLIPATFQQSIKERGRMFTFGETMPILVIRHKDKDVMGYLNGVGIRQLLESEVKEIQNTVYFLKTGKILTRTGIKNLDAVESEFPGLVNSDLSQGLDNIRIDEGAFLYAYYWLERNNVLLESKIDTQTIYAELIVFRNKIIVANIIFALILLTLAVIYSRRITTPIHKLVEATQNIRKGNLDIEIVQDSGDEIQILANEFELMRQKLQKSYQGMEEKIQRRTLELQEAQAQISHQEKMASLGMMAAGIAHEIGNPLTSISSMAQVIKRKNSDPKIEEYVINILKNIERISRIVREMVDFSRPSSYESAPSDVNDIIQSAVGIIRYDRRSKDLKYELNLDENLPKTVLVSDHLLQVFLNILINAVDASEDGGKQIEVRSFSKNGTIQVDISDQGTGIPDEMRNKIFEPFFTTKDVGKGTGLGLTVSYGIIQKLNGEIRVKNREGKGSTFCVIIPVRSQIED
ncbi:MAG: sensor histidine kinase [Calditrichales bacterium]|nr:MAG: sensor histidine kinase [Calditrichales bacterium]